jgi:hypothetical protein
MPLFNLSLISKYNHDMFQRLLYKHHLSMHTPKLIEFDDDSNYIPAEKGYFMVKDNVKYALPMSSGSGQNNLDYLPIRVQRTQELVTKNKEVVQWINKFTSFRVNPEHLYTFEQIGTMDGIEHQDQALWTLLKIITWTAYCRRINCIISGIRECGKTSYPDSLGQLTNKGYVIKQPRSIAGIALGVTNDGYLVLDEMGAMQSEQRRMVASFLFQQGERNITFRTGKGAALGHNVAASYDISNLSCLVLCNLVEDYNKPEQFFHFMFDNSQAINSRFLPLRINSPATPTDNKLRRELKTFLDAKQFKDTGDLTEETKNIYIGIMKSLEWYRVNWVTEVNYKRVDDAVNSAPFRLQGRHMLSYREILSGIYLYCKTLAEPEPMFERYVTLLNQWYIWYNEKIDEVQDKATVTYEDI